MRANATLGARIGLVGAGTHGLDPDPYANAGDNNIPWHQEPSFYVALYFALALGFLFLVGRGAAGMRRR